jgi:uncharacterized LabA/DUF88 family protein
MTGTQDRIVYVFIDASNLWAVQKTKGQFIDFEKLINYLKTRYKTAALCVYYYDAYPAEGTRDYDTTGKHKFFTYLHKGLGIEVRKKELKRIYSEESRFDDGMIEKGNMDVELTIDAVHYIQKYDTAILFTGDSDFLRLVKFIRLRGKKAYIFSSLRNVSTELKTGGDGYIDMLSIDGEIWGKDIKFREQKSP